MRELAVLDVIESKVSQTIVPLYGGGVVVLTPGIRAVENGILETGVGDIGRLVGWLGCQYHRDHSRRLRKDQDSKETQTSD